MCRRLNWVVNAYCLMSNHYHLFVQTPEGNLSAGMRLLNGVYHRMALTKTKRTVIPDLIQDPCCMFHYTGPQGMD